MSTAASSQRPLAVSSQASMNPLDRVIETGSGRILCIADIRGDFKRLNQLVAETGAVAVIHTGDFGFLDGNSPGRMAPKILRHVLLYNPLLNPALRSELLSMPHDASLFSKLNPEPSNSSSFQLSQLGALLSGQLELSVPVYTVYGPLEDIRVLEKFRTGEYEVKNLCILDESVTRSIEIGGLKLRLFGLGGGLQMHRIFDNGEGTGTIAGGNGTIWTTALQIGELVDSAERSYDPTETRILVTHGSIGRDAMLGQVALAVKADLTISGALHFRFVGSYNDYSVLPSHDALRAKFERSQKSFTEVYESAKIQLEQSMLPDQREFLQKALKVANKIPGGDAASGVNGKADEDEETAWKNCWNWNLSEAAYGHLLFEIKDGRVSAKTQSQGLNFGYRRHQQAQAPFAKENASVKHQVPRPDNAMMSSGNQSQQAQESFNKFGQFTRKPLNTGAPARNQPTAPIRSSAQIAPVQGKPEGTNGTSGGTKSPAGDGSFSEGGNHGERGVLRRGEREPRGGARGMGAGRGGLTRANGAQGAAGKAVEVGKTDGAPATTAGTVAETPVAAPAETSDKPTVAEEGQTGEGKTQEGWGAAVATTTTAAATGLPPARASRLVEKNPHTLYVKGLPQPCTDEELRGLWKEDVRAKITKTKIPVHPNGQNKDYGYVEFGNDEDMQAALANNAGAINGTTLSITVSNPPPETTSRRGGFGGRGSGGGRGAPGVRGGRGGFGRGGSRGGRGGAAGGAAASSA
ncbi:hypothetical protein NliqN6_5127 [Naganishia liquefaciens]|uniref:RRM domain-containing protein n=1 Tax=Naganishia liquefaciens TaxID=104408 RepID=A0A8H3TXN0_9TREE|nr:hypothetical protein NliqN6_5127 [Naganishia liquefaciens]